MAAARKLLIIDNSLDNEIYSPVGHWARHADREFDAVMPPLGEFPSELELYSHVIITGSEASILQDDEWILSSCELIRELAALQVPILASCFGHQLVVRALSGKEFVRAAPDPEFGWVPVVLAAPEGQRDLVFGELPSLFYNFTSHFDEVYPLPDDWTRLAWSERCANVALKWREGPIWGVQHHPEIVPEDGERLLRALPGRFPEKRKLIPSLDQLAVRDSQVAGALVRAFLANS